MAQHGLDAAFVQKTGANDGVLEKMGEENLDRDIEAGDSVDGKIDRCHASICDALSNAIALAEEFTRL
jgi:hypothetical protein